MSKKAKSKQPARKKYITAGALGYNQANYAGSDFASPYATNPFYYDAGAAMAAQQQMKSAMSASDVLKQRALEQNKARAEEDKAREAEFKASKEQSKAINQQELKSSGMEAGSFAVDLAKQAIAKQAAKKAATNLVANTAMQAGQAGVYGSTLGTAASTAANTASTATTAGTSLLPGAVEVGSQVGQAAAGTGSAAASTGASAAGTGASIGTGLATAGIGLGLNLIGTAVENSGDDNDYRTFTEKERKRNLVGSAMKSAGSGVGTGAAIGSFIPGVGTVIGGAIGGLVGGGIGLVKARKENKESKKVAEDYQKEQAALSAERAKEKALIESENAKIAGAYNAAFVKSRLTGAQYGYGYGTSNNPSMMTTPNFYGKTGGVKVPGGQIVPIEGSDAVEFVGRKHSQGGILLDPQTEVEGGETMDQVMMAKSGGKGNKNDYFFSAYLKLGGKSFAQRHKEILKSGGKQADIQKLAEMQEAVANKNGEKDRSPDTIASPNKVKYGGIHQYQTAGKKKKSVLDTMSMGSQDTGEFQYYPPTFYGDSEESRRDIEAMDKETRENRMVYGDIVPKDIYDAYQDRKWGTEKADAIPNFESELRNPINQINDVEEPTKVVLSNSQKEKLDKLERKLAKTIEKSSKKSEKEKSKADKKTKETTTETSYSLKDRGVSSSTLAGLGQLLPVGAVLAAPYRKTTGIDTSGAEFRGESVAPGAVVRGATLGRQSSGAEKAAAMANAAAMNKYIEGTNAGPGAIVGKLAVNAKLGEQLMKIQEQDDRANLALASKEAELGQRASEFNAQQAMEASAATAENRQRASENLQKAKMYNKNLELAEKQYKREEILGALDTAASRIAGIAKDKLSYDTAERYAQAIDETGSYDRFKMMELMEKDPEFASLTKEQKNKMIAQMEAQYKLDMMEKAKDKKMTGGTRRYTSRLGDLNRGKNKRNFNI